MRLTELEPHFLKIIDEKLEQWEGVSIGEADGLFLLCPVCFQKNNGPIGTHGIICYTPKVPVTRSPGPGRWDIVGTGFEDLSLQASPSSSVKLEGGCNAHFYVLNGEIQMCG